MSKSQDITNPAEFVGSVSANRQIRGLFYKLTLELDGCAAQAFSNTRPGQFVQVDLTKAALPHPKDIPEELADAAGRGILLRRPFSFCDITLKKHRTIAEILYCVVGPASLRMTTLSEHDSLCLIGPLGNGYLVPEGKKKAILIAGGMGAGPLIHLGTILANQHDDIETVAFVGAKTKFDLPFERPLDQVSQHLGFSIGEFAQHSMESFVATDDGSAGFDGPVTDCFLDWKKKKDIEAAQTVIYACGPEAMLAKVAESAEEKNIDCQVSLERRMACGIGLCQSCAVECKVEGSTETVYKLCCKDGPVFDAKEVVF